MLPELLLLYPSQSFCPFSLPFIVSSSDCYNPGVNSTLCPNFLHFSSPLFSPSTLNLFLTFIFFFCNFSTWLTYLLTIHTYVCVCSWVHNTALPLLPVLIIVSHRKLLFSIRYPWQHIPLWRASCLSPLIRSSFHSSSGSLVLSQPHCPLNFPFPLHHSLLHRLPIYFLSTFSTRLTISSISLCCSLIRLLTKSIFSLHF